MADDRHIEILLAITQQPIARFQLNFAWRSSFFLQNFGNVTDTRIPLNVFLVFLMQFGLRRAAPFGIVSDKLV